MRDDTLCRLGQIRTYPGSLWQAAISQRFLALASQDQDALRADCYAGLQVTQGVADAVYTFQVYGKPATDFLHHARFRFTAFTMVISTMRTIKQRVDSTAKLAQCAVHLVMDGIKGRHIKQSTANTGLVGRQRDTVAGLIQQRDGFQATRNRFPFIRALDEVGAIVIDDAVAV